MKVGLLLLTALTMLSMASGCSSGGRPAYLDARGSIDPSPFRAHIETIDAALTGRARLDTDAQLQIVDHSRALETEMRDTQQPGTMQIAAMEMGLFADTVHGTRPGTVIEQTMLVQEWRRLRSAFVPAPWFVPLGGESDADATAPAAERTTRLLRSAQALRAQLDDGRREIKRLTGYDLRTLQIERRSASSDADWRGWDRDWQEALDRVEKELPEPIAAAANTKLGRVRASLGVALLALRDLPSLHVIEPTAKQWADAINRASMSILEAEASLRGPTALLRPPTESTR